MGSFTVETTPELVSEVYKRLGGNLKVVRSRLKRPLTLTEKLLLGHLQEPKQSLEPAKAILALKVDRVALQDATAQMCLLQFMLAGRETTAVPTTVHCDHLIRARVGAVEDMRAALTENEEVYEFLKTCSQNMGSASGDRGPGSSIKSSSNSTPFRVGL